MKNSIFFLFLSLLCISCDEKNGINNLQNETVIIDNILYNQTETNTYTIAEVQINGNLLTIKISSSGCNGNTWKAVLVDGNEILESNPIQRNVKLSLKNNEDCKPVFEKEFRFDISILKEDLDRIILNLEGWNTQISYN